MLPSDQRHQLYPLVSNFNVVETLLCQINVEFLNACRYTLKDLAAYLNWILIESDVRRLFLSEVSD